MSDEKLSQSAFPGEELDATADTEREPSVPPPSTPVLGAALSVLWWETGEPRGPETKTQADEAK